MRRVLAPLLLLALAACEYAYGVARSVQVDDGIDPAELAAWARQRPGYLSAGAEAWDGEWTFHPFERGLGTAAVSLEDGRLSVGSCTIGRPPADEELDAWLLLQSELIAALRERFAFLPAATEWQVDVAYLESELAAAVERAARDR